MPTTPLFPLPEGLELTAISDTPEELLVCVTSHRASSPCPQCATPSSAIHSSYHRHPRDLPCIGRPIRLVFTVRKFFCRNPNCCRKVFAERLPDFIEASSRLTKRLRTSVQEIGFATCGKGGESLGNKLGMPISDASLLWSLFLVPLPEVGQVHIIGVDDWSWRRGKRFGSILVNLETRKIGEELGLARNTVRKYFRQPPDPPLPTPRPLRASQLDRYEDYLLARWSQGERNAAQLHREISERGYQGSVSMVRAYVGHLRTTTADGSPPRSRKERAQANSPRALRWLLARKREDLDQKEQARLEQLLNLSPEVQTIYALLHAFLEMVRSRKYQELRSWMEQAIRSGIPELGSFVVGIERDYDAVHAALRLPWSQGVTEGKVNKLKTLKRVMYGRAGFALLRQRLGNEG